MPSQSLRLRVKLGSLSRKYMPCMVILYYLHHVHRHRDEGLGTYITGRSRTSPYWNSNVNKTDGQSRDRHSDAHHLPRHVESHVASEVIRVGGKGGGMESWPTR